MGKNHKFPKITLSVPLLRILYLLLRIQTDPLPFAIFHIHTCVIFTCLFIWFRSFWFFNQLIHIILITHAHNIRIHKCCTSTAHAHEHTQNAANWSWLTERVNKCVLCAVFTLLIRKKPNFGEWKVWRDGERESEIEEKNQQKQHMKEIE